MKTQSRILATALALLLAGGILYSAELSGAMKEPAQVPENTLGERRADEDQARGPESQVGEVYELQAAFHRAKTTQDIDLMMSLWDPEGTLDVQGDPNSPYVGYERIRSFWLNSGSFTHHRFSLVPSFKTQINIHRSRGSLYFECHDIGNFDQPDRFFAADTFLAGTVRKLRGKWVFSYMTAGSAYPLSVDHYYFP